MQLNKEDGGNRKYILCESNENDICKNVTYKRLKNIQNELPHNLRYYKTNFIRKFHPEISSDRDDRLISLKLLKNIKELIELEHHIEIDNKKFIILENEQDLDDVIKRIVNNGKLFINQGVFLSRTQQRILDEKNITIIDIPEYYYKDELRKSGELW
ncbi:hypothetical protein NPA11_02060 [Mycoplasma sp. 1578d]|uniref:hypothetical protein n=1 Tax=Mycoplasma sp. 1578d TaxID=2967299 RepID=UPI00211C4998|nr:hypothetical protein [Mycoplasma sp. 1578d]UUM19541.1 hypothetical protein NPA11_02060 [Mycoplasma sp. 1578d]